MIYILYYTITLEKTLVNYSHVICGVPPPRSHATWLATSTMPAGPRAPGRGNTPLAASSLCWHSGAAACSSAGWLSQHHKTTNCVKSQVWGQEMSWPDEIDEVILFHIDPLSAVCPNRTRRLSQGSLPVRHLPMPHTQHSH